MKTLIIGASANPDRYAHRAALKLLQHGHEIELLGLREGTVAGHAIQTGEPDLADIDTVTLYVGPRNSGQYLDYLKKVRPRRVIFNPGAENPDLAANLQANGIEPVEACTLVMLSVGTF
jgi:uncharacterized protein